MSSASWTRVVSDSHQSTGIKKVGRRRILGELFLELVPHSHFADVSEAGHMVAGDRNDLFTGAGRQYVVRDTTQNQSEVNSTVNLGADNKLQERLLREILKAAKTDR